MILLDTQVLLWLLANNPRLGSEARQAIDQAWAAEEAAVSAISFWEVAMLHSKGRMTLLRDVETWRLSLLDAGLIEIPPYGRIAVRAGLLADMHGDPADRIIVSTALEGHRLVTADQGILEWPGALDRMDARA